MTVLEPVIEYLGKYLGPRVSLDQVIDGANRPRRPVLRVMDRLVREGHLLELADNPYKRGVSDGGRALRNPTWKIISKPILEKFVPRPKRVTSRDRLWRLIRARRRFTRLELQRLSGCSAAACVDFTQLLEKAGYVRVIGKDINLKVYMLVKDPGSIRPALKEKKHAQ